jgi:CBS domain-containing protein
MSPRAAARLETLGFTRVYDYVGGKRDWLAAALPTEGRLSVVPTAGDVLRSGDIACHLGDRLGDVVDRLGATGGDGCIVVDDHHVVLGRVRGRALDGDPNTLIETAMRSGPSTIRPDTPLETVVKTLRDGNVSSTLVTDPEGRLIGTLYLEDAERKLAEPDDR